MTIENLKEILITCDGKGKEAKEKALDEYIQNYTDKGLLDWIQQSPNPRLKLVHEEWLSAKSITLRNAIIAIKSTRPDVGFENNIQEPGP